MIEIHPYTEGVECPASNNKRFIHIAITISNFEDSIEDFKKEGH